MKKLVALVLTTLWCLLGPGLAVSGSPYDPESLVKWSGCKADVITSDSVSAIRSMYSPAEHTIYIGTATDVPLYNRVMITFHEIGHCLQYEGGFDLYADRVATELDADRLAAELACDYGMDGRRLLRELFEWAKAEFGYEGDSAHGTIAQRISQGDLALSCRIVPVQSP